MDYTMLVRDKELFTSIPCPIYQGEHNADTFKFIIPEEYVGTVPTLQIILPNNTGKIKSCELSEEPYKETYRTIFVPITDVITKYEGDMQIWLTFFPTAGDEQVIKTSISYVPVLKHEGFSNIGGGEFEDVDEIVQKITQLDVSVKNLQETKADGLKLDNETNVLSLMSGDKEISNVILPDDVTWEIIE